jgi:hypothetical protein
MHGAIAETRFAGSFKWPPAAEAINNGAILAEFGTERRDAGLTSRRGT